MPIAIIPMTSYFRWSMHWQGWILSAFAFGYLTSQIVGACAAKKYGGKSILLLSVLLWSISTIITPKIAHNIFALILCRIMSGLGEGLGLPTIFHIFGNNIAVNKRSSAFGYLVAAGSVGQTIASMICPHLVWQTNFYLFGSIGIVWSVIWVSLYSEKEIRTEELPLIINTSYYNASVNMKLKNFFVHWPLWAIYIAHFSMNWSNYIIMHWLPTYLYYLGANPISMSLTAIPYIFNSAFGVVAGNYADKLIDRRWSILAVRRIMTTIGLMGPAVFLLLFCTMNNVVAAIIFISLSMGLCACNSAGHLSNHAEVAPNHAGITFSVSNTLATIPGIICGPLTAELVTASHGRWYPVFILAAAINFTGSIIYCSQSSVTPML
ncbi:sialin-like isoform X2 [Adelges cooleyi]|nr:sialin-like isoform X2 [Adelges cooleyi]